MKEQEERAPQKYIVCLKADLEEEEGFSKYKLLDITVKRLPTDAQKVLKQPLTKKPSVITGDFNELRPTNVLFRYAFKPTDNILVCFRLHRIPGKHKNIVRNEIEAMLAARINKRATSPWAFSAVISKKTGGSPRFCVNYWAMNKKRS